MLPSTPGPGSGAVAVAQMGNSLVRALKTVIKYDRYQYQANFAAWKSGVVPLNYARINAFRICIYICMNMQTKPLFLIDSFESWCYNLGESCALSGIFS